MIGAIREALCIQSARRITVELIGGIEFRSFKGAVDKKFDSNRNTGRNSRPDNRRPVQCRAIGDIGGMVLTVGLGVGVDDVFETVTATVRSAIEPSV